MSRAYWFSGSSLSLQSRPAGRQTVMPGCNSLKAISKLAVDSFLVAGGELLFDGIEELGGLKFASVKDSILFDGPEEVSIMCVSPFTGFCIKEISEEAFIEELSF
jgi:hypothetical protein